MAKTSGTKHAAIQAKGELGTREVGQERVNRKTWHQPAISKLNLTDTESVTVLVGPEDEVHQPAPS